MNELLKALYDNFYEKLPASEIKAEIEECHQVLIDRLVLHIIDCKDQIAEDLSIDSFIAGFRLAMRLSQELNIYDEGRPSRPVWSEEDALKSCSEESKSRSGYSNARLILLQYRIMLVGYAFRSFSRALSLAYLAANAVNIPLLRGEYFLKGVTPIAHDSE